MEIPTIGRRRFRPQVKETGKRLRVNDQIRISPVRLISDENEQLGVIALDDAKRMAREAGLDLVEVSAQSSPPVCRIMDYGKWKYQQKKKEQKASSNSTKSTLKGVRLRPKIDKHDLEIKVNKAREFLDDHNKVQFVMLFRGREMAHRDLGLKSMNDICEMLGDISKIEAPPRMMGRRATMVLAPEKGNEKSKPKSEKKAGSAAEATPSADAQPQPEPEPASESA